MPSESGTPLPEKRLRMNPTNQQYPMSDESLRDFYNVDAVGIQTDTKGQRLWVCIDGQCILRIKGIKTLEILDNRIRESSK
jgi:hypothetical protein